MNIVSIKGGKAWRFTVNLASGKKTFYTATKEEGEQIAAILLGVK